jgi:L-alanine-DL-glutamate epimerase-like enolase superfamily enzyme
MSPGRGALFVHIKTDDGLEGLGITEPNARAVTERSLKPLLIGQDPLCHEKLWDDMFWRVRGFGRKGVAFNAISAVDIALWDLKAKSFGVPLYRLLGPYTDSVPIYGPGGWTNYTEAELVKEQMSIVVSSGLPIRSIR